MADGLFKGRTAVVTGGARGIGLACAAKIAAGGGRLALWDRDLDRAEQSAAALGDAIAVEVDVTSEASSTPRSQRPRTNSRRPTSWSRAPASPDRTRRSRNYPVDAWRQVIDINLTGVFLCNRAVAAA